MRRVNGLEIVNGDVVEGKFAGWPLWARMLNAGLHLTAIGGSDDHTADETADRAVGNPATVVYARELSEPALLEGLSRGLAYVRTRGPGGPALEFEAFSGDRRWRMGDTVPNSIKNLTLSAVATQSAGQHLQWIRNGNVISTTGINEGQPIKLPVATEAGDWFSIILRDDRGPTLFSNAIYVSQPER